MSGTLLRDGLELLFLVAVAGMLWQVGGKLLRGEIEVYRCPRCQRPASRAYPLCQHCGQRL